MKISRRAFLAGTTTALALAGPASAHHGWRWTDGGEFELTGLIMEVRLGNPHGELTIDADGEVWLAEIGQPYRNEAAGLTEDMLTPGTEVTILGERSANPDEKLVKAERVTIDGKNYDLYPDRL